MKEILLFLCKKYPLTDAAMNYILKKCDEKSLKKGEVLLKEGEVCSHVYFIKKGMLKSSLENNPEADGPVKIYINWFMIENDIATSVISFWRERRSLETIVAMEDTIVFKMSRKDLITGITRFTSVAILTLFIVFDYYCESRYVETCLRLKKHHLIYQWLRSRNNNLLERVPEKDMASYLGVSAPVYRDIRSRRHEEYTHEMGPDATKE